ncbi:MAG: rod shape-determining protein MreC, partial [Bacteroidota bacterium]
FTGRVNETSAGISSYFRLTDTNLQLAEENAFLRRELARMNAERRRNPYSDSIIIDSSKYVFRPAQVINKSVNRTLNFITLDKGKSAGLYQNMGVMGQDGIVGQVRDVSENFSTVFTLIHTELLTSVYHEASGAFASTQWDGNSPRETKLLFLPRHIEIEKGDSIFTSGFNSVFPPDLLVGTVSSISLPENSAFYDINVRLATDYSSLRHVYYVQNLGKLEKDSLELNSTEL